MSETDQSPEESTGDGRVTAGNRRAHAGSFGSVAAAYERARPGYPDDAVAWLLGPGRLDVVELGAGTGKLTESLVAAGHDVFATDPSPEMLGHLKTLLPGTRTAVATAEAIPAPSRSVDIVVCAQAFHWFDHARALPELARVLRPGGHLAVVWNIRDEAIPWVRKLSRIIGQEPTLAPELSPLQEAAHFGPVEDQTFRNWSTHTLESLLDLVRSRSYIALLDEPERAEILGRVTDLYTDYGRGHDGMQLPYVTKCYRAVVHHQEPPPVPPPARLEADPAFDPDATQPVPRPGAARPSAPADDPATTLIDFR